MENNIKRNKKSDKMKNTFDMYGKNTSKGLRIKQEKQSSDKNIKKNK